MHHPPPPLKRNLTAATTRENSGTGGPGTASQRVPGFRAPPSSATAMPQLKPDLAGKGSMCCSPGVRCGAYKYKTCFRAAGSGEGGPTALVFVVPSLWSFCGFLQALFPTSFSGRAPLITRSLSPCDLLQYLSIGFSSLVFCTGKLGRQDSTGQTAIREMGYVGGPQRVAHIGTCTSLAMVEYFTFLALWSIPDRL